MRKKSSRYNLWAYTASEFISGLGNGIYTFGISLFILGVTGSAISFAVNLVLSALPRAILAPFAGYIADRYPRKRIILISRIASSVIMTSLLLFSILYEFSLPVLYTATILLSITSLFTEIALRSAVSSLVQQEHIQKAVTMNQAANSFSMILGPIIAGTLYAFTSINLFFLIQLTGFLLTVIIVSTMDFKMFHNETDLHAHQEKFVESIKSGLRYIRNDQVLSVIVLISLVVNFFAVCVVVGMPFIVLEEANIQPAHYGIIEGMFALGMLIASIILSVKQEFRFPLLNAKKGILAISLLMLCMPIPLFFSFNYFFKVVYFLIIALSYGMMIIYINTPVGVMLQKTIDDGLKGRVFGFLEVTGQVLSPLSMMLYGVLFDFIGGTWTLLATGAVLFFVTLYLIGKPLLRQFYPELENSKSIF